MLVAAVPPQPVPIRSSFDYVTIDAKRHRVYAAHTGSRALLVVDADSAKIVGQIAVGTVHGVAVDEKNGNVFTGNGTDDSVSEIDPASMRVLRTADVPGRVDAIAYDAASGRVYADEDDGTRLFVIDAATMKLVKTIAIPGHKPEYLAVDPQTHDVYQNISDRSEIVVIDAATLRATRTIPTPEIVGNHPLQYDPELRQIVVAGTNGVMSAYDPTGKRIGSLAVPRFDQCSLDRNRHILACAGSGGITRIRLRRRAAPELLDTTPIHAGIHTVGVDSASGAVFAVWSNPDGSGDFVQKLVPN